jgi:hypothetical protein
LTNTSNSPEESSFVSCTFNLCSSYSIRSRLAICNLAVGLF